MPPPNPLPPPSPPSPHLVCITFDARLQVAVGCQSCVIIKCFQVISEALRERGESRERERDSDVLNECRVTFTISDTRFNRDILVAYAMQVCDSIGKVVNFTLFCI